VCSRQVDSYSPEPEEEHSTLPPDELNGMEEEQIQKHMAIALYLRGSPL
jgi:hypothetical protein